MSSSAIKERRKRAVSKAQYPNPVKLLPKKTCKMRQTPHPMLLPPFPRLFFFPGILGVLVPCWESVVCQVPRQRSSAKKLWQGFQRGSGGACRESERFPGHTPPSQRHRFQTAVVPCSQTAARHCPALWSQGPSGVGPLSLTPLFQTSTGQGWKRHIQAVFSMFSLHLWP